VSEEAVALYQPLILPLSRLLLIAADAHSPKPHKVVQKRRKGKRKRRKAHEASPARKHKTSAVVRPFARKA